VKNPLRVAETVDQIFGDDLHARRVQSLANGVVGTVDAAVMSIHAIGRGYAQSAGKSKKHGVKQADRLIGNAGVSVWALFEPWVQFVVGPRTEIVVALDWTEFDADDHATLAGYLITSHGRATPLIWKTVKKSELEGRRNDHEYRLLERLHECLPPTVAITVLADRGFGDQKLYRFLETLGWDYIIRFRAAIQVEAERVNEFETPESISLVTRLPRGSARTNQPAGRWQAAARCGPRARRWGWATWSSAPWAARCGPPWSPRWAC
jgi:hypothetical protein